MHPFAYIVIVASLAYPVASTTHVWICDSSKQAPHKAQHVLPSTTLPDTLAFLLVSTCTDKNRCAIACLDIPSCIVTQKAMHRIKTLPIDIPFSPTAIAHIITVDMHIDAPFQIPVHRYEDTFSYNCLYWVLVFIAVVIMVFHADESLPPSIVYIILVAIAMNSACVTCKNMHTFNHVLNATIAPPPTDPCAPYITAIDTFLDHYAQCRAKIAVSNHAFDIAANILQHIIARSVFTDPDILLSAARVDIQRARPGANMSRVYAYVSAAIGADRPSIVYNTVRAHNVLAAAHLIDHNPSLAEHHSRVALSFALLQPPSNLISLEISIAYRTLASVYIHADEFNVAVSYFEKMLRYQARVFPVS